MGGSHLTYYWTPDDIRYDWVSEHRHRLNEAFELARKQLEKEADQRKAYYDRRAQDLPLADGERVYLRERGLQGRNNILPLGTRGSASRSQ